MLKFKKFGGLTALFIAFACIYSGNALAMGHREAAGDSVRRLDDEIIPPNLSYNPDYYGGHRVATTIDLLAWAVFDNDLGAVKGNLRRMNISPNTPDIKGWTLLHIAASKGYTDIVKTLLEKTKALITNDAGQTPIDVAATSEIKKLIESKHLPVKDYKEKKFKFSFAYPK